MEYYEAWLCEPLFLHFSLTLQEDFLCASQIF